MWGSVGTDGLYRNGDLGESPWEKVPGIDEVRAFGFGAPLADGGPAAVFVYGRGAGDPERGLWRSDDGGATWTRANATPGLGSSYMNRLTADPRNRDAVYVMGQSIRRSEDGGKTLTFFRGAPGGDISRGAQRRVKALLDMVMLLNTPLPRALSMAIGASPAGCPAKSMRWCLRARHQRQWFIRQALPVPRARGNIRHDLARSSQARRRTTLKRPPAGSFASADLFRARKSKRRTATRFSFLSTGGLFETGFCCTQFPRPTTT
jgi:hypothetical protein